jgi:hypothetical protein
MFGLGCVALATAARAEETPPESEKEAAAEAEAAAPEPLGSVIPGLGVVDEGANKVKDFGNKWGITLGMGMSFSYQYSWNDPPGNELAFRLLDKDVDRFGLDLAQITIAKPTPNPGDWGFMFQPITGRFSTRYQADWNGDGIYGSTDFEQKESEFQQGYFAYNVPVGNGIQLKLGKFNTLVGSEVNEPWLNPNWSRQLVYTLAQPATHTGGLASYAINDKVAVTAGGIQGWDNFEDNNSNPSFIGQVGLTPIPQETLLIGAIVGPEQTDTNSNNRTLVDVVNIWKPFDGFLMQTNLDFGQEEGANAVSGGHATFWGISNTVAYDFTPRFNMAFRAEWFDDQDGARTGTSQGIWELTLDAKYKITDYMYTRGEFRNDESSRRRFPNGSGFRSGQPTIAWEVGYVF